MQDMRRPGHVETAPPFALEWWTYNPVPGTSIIPTDPDESKPKCWLTDDGKLIANPAMFNALRANSWVRSDADPVRA